jgi:hypothetical protein
MKPLFTSFKKKEKKKETEGFRAEAVMILDKELKDCNFLYQCCTNGLYDGTINIINFNDLLNEIKKLKGE